MKSWLLTVLLTTFCFAGLAGCGKDPGEVKEIQEIKPKGRLPEPPAKFQKQFEEGQKKLKKAE